MDIGKNYFCVVEVVLDGIINKYQFDYVEDTNTKLSTTITTHPIVNGDIISDHMYREPIKETISGKFSLFGNNRYDYGKDKLLNIQNTFERIMNEGIFCKIYKMNKEGNQTRFKIRENMILDSISWIESESSLGFSFDFTEAITADILNEDIQYDVDVTDENLPALTDPETLDFTDELLNIEEVTKIVIQILNDEKLLTSEFLEYVAKTFSSYQIAGAVAGLIVGVVALKTIVAICGGLSSAVPVGTIIAAAIAVTTFVAIGIIGIVKASKKGKAQKLFKTEAFKYYKNDLEKTNQEVIRFANYTGTIHQNLQYLNDNILIYGIGKNVNQDLLLYIDNVYYNFRFIKDNNTLNYGIEVNTFDDTNSSIYNKQNISEICCTSIDQCKSEKNLFSKVKDTTHQVFLINKSLGNYLVNDAKNTKKIKESKEDLTNYIIMVSKVNMNEFNDTLYDIIRNAMTM